LTAEFDSASAAETESLGRRLGALLSGGELVCLLGELGEKRAGPSIVGVMGEKWFFGALRTQAHKALRRLYPDARPGFDDDRLRTDYGTVVTFWKKHVKATGTEEKSR